MLHTRTPRLSYLTILRIHLSRLPARYIPGGVWQTVSRAVDFELLKVEKIRVATTLLLEMIIPPLVAITLGCLLLNLSDQHTLPPLLLTLSLLFSVVALAVVHFVTNRIVPLPILHFILAVVSYAASWACYSLSFYLFVTAFTHTPIQLSYLFTTGMYLLSWAVGYLCIFTPQGIGVFEAVAGYLLSNGEDPITLAALLVSFRVVTLVSDMTMWALGTLSIPKERSAPPGGESTEYENDHL